MRAKHILLGLLAAGTAFMAVPDAANAQARNCDRVCLTKVMDDYLAAAKAHDATSLPLHASVKYTENGQRVNVGDGLWRTFSVGPLYRMDVVDEDSGQIAILGILEEGGNRNFFSTRIAVEENAKMGRGLEITEIENLVIRNITLGERAPAKMALERDEFNQVVPAAKRSSREELMRLADAYFTGLDTDESAQHVPFADTCLRIENGSIMANNPKPVAEMGMASLGCKAQFDTGFSTIVTDVRERRYPVIDVEKGLIYALAFLDHDGSVERYTDDSGESDAPQMMRQPFSFMMAEVFHVRDAKIDQIEAVLTAVPYRMESGW